MTDAERAAYLAESCAASGVPLVPDDEVTLRRIAHRLIDAAATRKRADLPSDAA